MISLKQPMSDTTAGVTIGILLFFLAMFGIALFYQAQVIANQQSVIQMMERPMERP